MESVEEKEKYSYVADVSKQDIVRPNVRDLIGPIIKRFVNAKVKQTKYIIFHLDASN